MKFLNIATLRYIAAVVAFCAITWIDTVNAQDDIDDMGMPEEDVVKMVVLPNPPISELKPLFWMPEELEIINQVKRGVIHVVPIDESEIQGGLIDDTIEMAPKTYLIPRDLKLSGLIYNTEDDWSLWINGIKVTPKKKMDEIRHLSVYKDYIEIKWFDAETNRIYPVRMRPYQRFNIDTGRFLPL
jgi:hypothetical protein